MAYIGVSPSNGVRRKHTYTATAAQTSFSGAGAEGITLGYLDSNYVDVYQNGVKLSEADYTSTSGTAIVLATGATASDMIEVVVYDVFSVADTVSKSAGGTFDGNITAAGTITVTGNADLNGDLDVDGTTNLDAVDVDGAVNFAADVTFANGADIITASAGTSNFRAGVNAGNSIASGGNYNTVVGDEAGTALTTGDRNTAVGYAALDAVTTASYNTAIGYNSATANTSGASNVSVGDNTFSANLSGDNNTTIGQGSLRKNTTGDNNVAVGMDALKFNTEGTANVAVGAQALDANTEGNYNVAIGKEALTSDTLGSRSVAIGQHALQVQNFASATDTYNVAVGYDAGVSVTTGIRNTIIGGNAGVTFDDADYNVGIGFAALNADTRGSRSTAVGYNALGVQNFGSATDAYNTAVGFHAGVAVTTAVQSVYIGGLAGDADQTGGKNVYVGYSAGTLNAGDQNVFIGRNAGGAITDGDKNTIIGTYDGNEHSLDLRTSDNHIVLSDGDGNPRFAINNNGRGTMGDVGFSGHRLRLTQATDLLAINATSSNSGQESAVQFRKNGSEVGFINVTTSSTVYGTSSDYRLKENVVDMTGAIDRVKKLLPKKFNFIIDADTTVDGFLAHEAQAIIPEAVSGVKDAVEVWKDGEELPNGVSVGDNKLDDDGNTIPTMQGIDHSKVVPLLTGALKEAIAKIESLEARITTLEG
ncbi:tail fiber domain-containing protein [bacterium]|nr:tail fiber domain-containing protein [bacterium]